MVRWLHMVESNAISSFLDGQEIAFTTGVGLNRDETLLDLVKANNEHKASGMVINIGPFIKEVPKDVIDYCNKEGFSYKSDNKTAITTHPTFLRLMLLYLSFYFSDFLEG